LSGEQGVIIPRSNVRHLMVREDVVAALRTGQFHIWAVGAIDEGLEILTGELAGARDFEGYYPKGSLNGRIDQRLREFIGYLREASEAESGASLLT
jgi:predicted ATP-dependent protease